MRHMVHSSPPGNFVFMIWEVAITMSGVVSFFLIFLFIYLIYDGFVN